MTDKQIFEKLRSTGVIDAYYNDSIIEKADSIFESIEKDLTINKEIADKKIVRKVINLIGEIVKPNVKQPLYKFLFKLHSYEHKASKFLYSSRDHVIHALLVYNLGACLNEIFIKQYNPKISDFQWKITSLFHDIGYSYLISNDLTFQADKTKNRIIYNITGHNDKVVAMDYYMKYAKLQSGENAFDFLFKRLESWKLDVRKIKKNIKDCKKLDHGIMSSLVLYTTLDKIYQEFNPNRDEICYKNITIKGENYNLNFSQRIFEGDITDICAAIFIHNLDEGCFENNKINIYETPLAYLLKLSDELQDWNRPKFDKTPINASDDYNFEVINSKLVISCKINYHEKLNKYLIPGDLIESIMIAKS